VRLLRLAAGLALSAGLLAYLLWTVDLAQLAAQLRATDWGWTAAGAALAPLGLWVRAVRWRYLFPPRARPRGLVAGVMIGYMANNLLPLRAGELVRIWVVARRGAGFWTVLATLVVERVLDSLVVVLLLAVLGLLIPVPPLFQWAAAVLLGVDLAAMAGLGFAATAPARCQRVLLGLTRRWPALAARLGRGFETFVQGLEGIRTRGHAPGLVLWTALVWLAPALSAWMLLRALHLELPLLAGFTVLAFVGLGVSVPSAPGYVGVFHYAAVLAVERFGVPRPAALGFALLFHAAHVVTVTLVGWLFLLREPVSLAAAARARPGAPAGGA